MADEGNVISDLNLGNGEDTGPSAGIISQYVKDLSVENPNSPQSFSWQDQPQIDVQFNRDSHKAYMSVSHRFQGMDKWASSNFVW